MERIHTTPIAPSLHPTLVLRLPTRQNCSLHLELTLPDALFFDRNQLQDIWYDREWTLRPEVIDIERPEDERIDQAVLNLSVREREETLQVPLHARYLPPGPEGSREVVLRDFIKSSWYCGTDVHLQSTSVDTVHFTIPVGKPAHQPAVELCTAVGMWLGWAYLVYKMIRLVRRSADPKKAE